jgi:L-fuculose-phosphate aldolase
MVSDVSISKQEDIDLLMQELIEVGRNVVNRGLAVGSGGNLSFRVPNTDTFFITATGTQLDQLVPSNFVLVGLNGDVTGVINPSSEFRVHLESYKSRPDVDVCIHLHPQASVLAASLNLPMKFLTIDHVYYVRNLVRIPWIQSGSQEIADATGVAVKTTNVVILENHGCVVLAPSVQLAFARVLNLEEASELTIRCHELNLAPIEVPHAYWDYLRENDL